ncbi:MAG: hypothetical protein JOZ54_06835 [Acidobacteria bacterium]|nr:hypothetical protein [Acidobacteriota bacterium]
MKTAVFAALLLAAPTLFAQYPDQARDLRDAQRLLGNLFQQLKPALDDAQQTADTLALIASVHKTLVEDPPLMAVDKALERMADFIERAEKAGKPLSRENFHAIKLVQQLLSDTKLGPQPPDLLPIREKIHHENLSELQRRVVNNQGTLQSLKESLQRLDYVLNETITGSTRAVGASVTISKP